MTKTGKWIVLTSAAAAIASAGFSATAFASQTQPVQLQIKDKSKERLNTLTTRIDGLFGRLVTATSQTDGRAIENEIWKNWMALPAPAIRRQVAEAMRARRSYNFEKARKILDQVVKQAPDYAEGWNQRAFVLFLQQKYDASLADIDKALQLEPRHFGAMAGKARILMSQGRFELGQKILRKAVKIHPYMRERSMIIEPKKEKL